MKRTFKILTLVLCIILLVVPFAGCNNNEGTSSGSDSGDIGENEPYRFAVIYPMTGNLAQHGIAMTRAIQMQFDKVNEEGGINGHMLEFEVFDDANDPKESVNCVEMVLEDDTFLAVFGPHAATNILTVAPTLQDAGIAQITSTGHVDFTGLYTNTIRSTLTQEQRYKLDAEFAYNTLGARTCALLYLNDDNGIALEQMFGDNFKELGGEIVGTETYLAETVDFNALCTTVIATNPDVIHLSGYYQDVGNIVRTLDSLGWDKPLLATGSSLDPTLLELTEGCELAEKLYMLAPINFYDDSPEFVEWKTAWQDAYGEIPSNSQAINFTEAAKAVIQALKAGATTRESLIEWLRNTPEDIEGITGSYRFIDGDADRTCFTVTIRDGEFATWTEGMPL